MLRPKDLILVLKLAANRHQERWTYAELSKDLGVSASQVFRSVARAEAARLLYTPATPSPHRSKVPTFSSRPNIANLKEFLVHGAKYSFPPERGGMTRGIPTAHAGPTLAEQIAPSSEPPPVWPFAEGRVRGLEFSPLYKTAPQAAQSDPKLYELLTLVDAIRDGRAREREIAIRELVRSLDAP
jgi:hypothetical protein